MAGLRRSKMSQENVTTLINETCVETISVAAPRNVTYDVSTGLPRVAASNRSDTTASTSVDDDVKPTTRP